MIKEPSKKQIELLLRVAPGPLGCGMKIDAAAENLGVSTSAAKSRLQTFKKNFPEAWQRFSNLRKVSRKQRLELRWKDHYLQKLWLPTFTELSSKAGAADFLRIAEENNQIVRRM